jgi:hypothetical protein
MIALIKLTTAGTDAGPFNLYSNLDGYLTPFEINITRSQLLAGYTSSVIPDGSAIIRVKSIGVCTNFVDLPIPGVTTTTSTTVCASYHYSFTPFNCPGCTSAPPINIDVYNATPLVFPKFYFYGTKILLIDTFFGCSAHVPDYFLLSVNGQDTCQDTCAPADNTWPFTFTIGHNSPEAACSDFLFPITLYSGENPVQDGTSLYTDHAMTIPFDGIGLFYHEASSDTTFEIFNDGTTASPFTCF